MEQPSDYHGEARASLDHRAGILFRIRVVLDLSLRCSDPAAATLIVALLRAFAIAWLPTFALALGGLVPSPFAVRLAVEIILSTN